MGDAGLDTLTGACADVRAASAEDAVAGVVPRYRASPATVAEASALLRAAAGLDLAVVPRGGGTKLDWGTPPRRCDLVVDTARLDHVVEHASGDLVARVQAGVPMSRLAGLLGEAGQQLALDPPPRLPPLRRDGPGPGGATVGGTLATGAAGPRRLRYGTPRDLVIGITVVRADGVIAHSGGKVVKNVAGYDLGKLYAGSHGTLGLIVEAVFRLHPLPGGVAYAVLDCDGPQAAHRAAAAAAASELAPTAVELDRPARGQPIQVGVLLDGDTAGVAERVSHMVTLLGDGARVSETAPSWWGWPGQAPGGGPGERPAGTLIRVAFWAGALPRIVAVIDAAAGRAGVDPALGGSAGAGVIYAWLADGSGPEAVMTFVSGLREAIARGEGNPRPQPAGTPPVLASAVVVHAPPQVRDLVDMWGPVSSAGLMRAVKEQFDPTHRMAPGRFAGGI